MIDFSSVAGITIPEGMVKELTIGGLMFWRGAIVNLLKYATDDDRVTIYNGIGYKQGVRLSASAGGITTGNAAAMCTSGYINAKPGDVLRIGNVKMNQAGTSGYVMAFDENNVMTGYKQLGVSTNLGTTYFEYPLDSETYGDNFNAIRFSTGVIDETSIVTINQSFFDFTITHSLTNVSINNTSKYANKGDSYIASVTVGNGYQLDSVVVAMGGVDITDSAYSEGLITIPSVTGDIVITATASALVTYTNLVPTSIESDGSIYNGIGYKDGGYLSSSNWNSVSSSTDSVVTGYMPYALTDDGTAPPIYVKGVTMSLASHCRFCSYNSSFGTLSPAYGSSGNYPWGTNWQFEELGTQYYKITPVNTSKVGKYVRLSALGTGENLIVTVDEEITD